MSDGILEIIQESRKNKYSPIWNCLSDADVIAIWENVSQFIEKNMLQQKGVSIPGLGTFAFSQTKLDVGNNKYLLLQRPVFVLLEKFAMTHGLQHNKYTVPGSVPVIPLNMSQLSFESPYDRDTTELCIREIVGAFGRSVATRGHADFAFSGIGRLLVQNSRVKMRFYKTFVNSMDGSGKLVESLQGRPETADSVMSERCGSRLSRSSTSMEFQRKLRGFDEDDFNCQSGHLPVIDEEEDTEQLEHLKKCAAQDLFPVDDHQFLPENDEKEFELQTDEPLQTNVSRSDVSPSATYRIPLAIPRASVMSFEDDEAVQKDDRKTSPLHLQRPTTSPAFSNKRAAFSTSVVHQNGDATSASPNFRGSCSALDDSIFHLEKSPSPPGTASSCGHSNSGQELCYLCHQRARRNVAVNLAEERRRKEAEEDELLRQFQEMKAASEDLKDKEKLLVRRHENQKVSAFNLGIAEANAEKKLLKEDFTPSFVFQRRLLTPPQFLVQRRYQTELESQIADKEASEKKQKMDEAFMGRLEQSHLAEELASQKAKNIKEKFDQREEYRRALSAQLKMKPEPIPASFSSSGEPYFGKNDMDSEKMAEKRRKARELYSEQVALVEQKKREEILKRLEEQRREENMLCRVKQECVSDTASKYDMLLKKRKSLEADWMKAAEAKRERDLDQRLHDKAGGRLVHEQCDRYKRCRQCKRRTDNVGETNIWRETKYLPGTRIMA